MIYDVRHVTEVKYTRAAKVARFNVRLQPADFAGQELLDYELRVEPAPSMQREVYGPFVVHCTKLAIGEPLERLRIESRFRVEVHSPVEVGAETREPTVAEIRRWSLETDDISAISPASYLYPSPVASHSDMIGDWAEAFFQPQDSVFLAGHKLMAVIFHQFQYDGTATMADTPPQEAFDKKRGVCQDFAHIMIMAARAHGVPAAYVSGYLRTVPPVGQPRLVGADAMHAWASLWCGAEWGWVGFDPTNNRLAGEDHIQVAIGRDFGDVSPLDGVLLGGGGQQMRVAVDVIPQE